MQQPWNAKRLKSVRLCHHPPFQNLKHKWQNRISQIDLLDPQSRAHHYQQRHIKLNCHSLLPPTAFKNSSTSPLQFKSHKNPPTIIPKWSKHRQAITSKSKQNTRNQTRSTWWNNSPPADLSNGSSTHIWINQLSQVTKNPAAYFKKIQEKNK